MTTRMEKVAEDVALTVLRKTGSAADPPFQPETLKEAFQARWPTPDSRQPMNDAMSAAAQAASSCTGQDVDSWKTTVSQAWQPAVKEVVEEYFKTARHSFEKGEPLERSGNSHRRRESDAGSHRRCPGMAAQYRR